MSKGLHLMWGKRTQEHEGHSQEIEERQRSENNCGLQRVTSEGIGNERYNRGDGWHTYCYGAVTSPSEQHETGVPVCVNENLEKKGKEKRTDPISVFRYSARRSRYGTSQAKNLIIFIPPNNSWTSFTLLSVQTMPFPLILKSCVITFPCTGVKITKMAKPARTEGPNWMMSNAMQIQIEIGAVHAIWKKPAQKSMRDTSVEMWFTSFPFVSTDRERDVSLRARS